MNRWLLPVAAAIAALAIVAVQQPALAVNVPATPVDPEACDDGTIVTDPTNNTELVADCRVLAGMKETLEGTSNVRRRLNWSATRSLWSADGTASEWEGITVGGSPRRVTRFELDSSDNSGEFNGNVPAALGSLTGLTFLKIHWQQIGGSFSGGGIPSELGNLVNLVHLQISSTKVHGQIPPELGKLSKLQTLDFGGSNLSGEIPPEIWGIQDSETYPGLTELRSLRLYGNKNINGGRGFTGTLPPEIKNLTKLNTLHLHGNKFSGPIPTEITQLSTLQSLTLYENDFTGTVPPGLGSLPLRTLDLSRSLLTGSIPTELENLLPELSQLRLVGNSWTGCVPRRLLEVETNDIQFIVDYYGLPLCGSIANPPPSISSATVDGATLTLTYSESLDTTSTPDTSDYTVTVNGSTSEHTVDGVSISSSRVTLTLDPAVVASDIVLISYTPGSGPVQDSGSAGAASLTDEEVTNNTTPAPPVYDRKGVVDGGTLTLNYSEDLDLGSQPDPSAYTVTVNGSDRGVNSVFVDGTTVSLTLATPVQGGQTVRLSYTPPSTDPLQDVDGEDAAQLTNESITNNTDRPPTLDSGKVDGDTLTLKYNEPLDANAEPAPAAYTVTVDTVARGVDGVDVSGSAVTLTLASAVVGGETVFVSYDSSQAVDALQDSSGTAAEDLTDQRVDNVTNNVPVFTSTAFTVAEKTQPVGTVVAEDADDPLDTVHSYILKPADPDDDGRMFAITNSGALSFKDPHGADFEHSGAKDDSNVYRVTIMATSGSGTRERMSLLQQFTVTITNAEEDGELLFSSEQPQVGTSLLATVDDPDGSVTVTTWTWEISSDQSDWTTLTHQTTPNTPSASYAPVAADAADGGKYIRVTADYEDAVTGTDQVQRTLTNRVRAQPTSNSAPTFPSSETGQRSIAENTSPNVNIGQPVVATDPERDLLTYSLDGTDADSFDIVALSGQLRTSAPLDFETKPSYTVVVTATDPSRETAGITVTITVTDITEHNWNNPGNTGGNSGGGFTGFGGGLPAGPTPSDDDFEWNVTGDIDLDPANDDPTGLWGRGAVLWVGQNGDGANDGVFAYDLESGDRLEDLEFELAEMNLAPRGVWSDGETMWVSDSGQNHLFAYDLESGDRVEDAEFELGARNRDARGIWSDGDAMWVLDARRDMIVRYDLATGASLGEFALAGANDDPHGIWSDGVAIWVSDDGERKIFAYRLKDGELARESDEDFTELRGAGNNSPRGIWSDGGLMYVVDANDDKIYTYNMPDAFDVRLASLTLSDVEIGEFASYRTEYTGIPADGATETTVEAVAVQPDATIVIAPDDADGNARNGRQVLLDGSEITVTVTSEDGSRTRTYRVQIEIVPDVEPPIEPPVVVEPPVEPPVVVEPPIEPPVVVEPSLAAPAAAEPEGDCLIGLTGGRFDLTIYTGGSVAELRDCMREFELMAVWDDPEEEWVPMLIDGTELVNRPFVELFPEGVPASTPFVAQRALPTPTEAPAAPEPEGECLIGLRGGRFDLTIYAGGSLAELKECMREFELMAIWDDPEGEWVPLLIDGTELVNRPFVKLFPEGIPASTPFVAQRDLPQPTPDPEPKPEPKPTPEPELAPAIGNTGGDGVSHRTDCADAARVSAIGGWSDGVQVEVLGEGRGRCSGWLLVHAEDVTSWVHTDYVVGFSPATADEQTERLIGNTGGDGVSHRNECADAARLSEAGGWADGTEIEVLADGRGRCAGWLWVEADGVTSWVREQYLLDPAEDAPTPSATDDTPADGTPADDTPADDTPADGAAITEIWWVIGNTGRDGVSHRNECSDDARLSEIGGWPDGTGVEILEEGSGNCAGWLRVRAGGVTSWVREEYVLESSGVPAAPEIWMVIGDTGGDGISHRNECSDDARVSELGGWPDGTEVEILEEGSGDCTGWLRVQADGLTSWVREQYVLEYTGAVAMAPATRHVIANTGGDGISYRSACADGARVSKIGGWSDGTEVEVLEEGSGDCAGWLRVQADGVTSWVREQYVVEYTAGSGMGAGD